MDVDFRRATSCTARHSLDNFVKAVLATGGNVRSLAAAPE